MAAAEPPGWKLFIEIELSATDSCVPGSKNGASKTKWITPELSDLQKPSESHAANTYWLGIEIPFLIFPVAISHGAWVHDGVMLSYRSFLTYRHLMVKFAVTAVSVEPIQTYPLDGVPCIVMIARPVPEPLTP